MGKRPQPNGWSSGLAGVFLVAGLLWQYGPDVWVLCGVSSTWVARWHHAVATICLVVFLGIVGLVWRGQTDPKTKKRGDTECRS